MFLTKTLQWCTALVHVVLCNNEAIANVTLEVFSHLNDTLKFLNLSNCVGFEGSLEPLRSFPEIGALVLAGVSGAGREPRAFEGPAGLGDVGRRSLRRSCRRPGAAVVSAEAQDPQRL